MFMNGHGPARPATNSYNNCSFGGSGFGAGGSGSNILESLDYSQWDKTIYNPGGDGADGFVYVEW